MYIIAFIAQCLIVGFAVLAGVTSSARNVGLLVSGATHIGGVLLPEALGDFGGMTDGFL